jgi:DNA mismatch repair protein MutS
VVRRAGALLAALEERAGRLTDAAALPLFAATGRIPDTAIDTRELDPLHAAVAAIDPDKLTPREALEAIYRLSALIAVALPDDALR